MCNISQGIREEAYNEAYEEAYEEARALALVEGREESRIQIAKKMFQKNMPIEEIIEFTELPRQIILDFDKS